MEPNAGECIQGLQVSRQRQFGIRHSGLLGTRIPVSRIRRESETKRQGLHRTLSSERGGEGLACGSGDSQSLGDASSPDYPQERTVGNNRHASKKESPKRAHYEGPRKGLLGPAKAKSIPREIYSEFTMSPGAKKLGPRGRGPQGPSREINKEYSRLSQTGRLELPNLQLAVTKGSASQ